MKFTTGNLMVLDIYVPTFNLAFEYQGHHHYHDSKLFGGCMSHQQRDYEKHHLSGSHGITLIEVPYWWQRDKDSLATTLHKYRPDISSLELVQTSM